MNQQYHRKQSKKRSNGLYTGWPGHKQHKNNKCTYLYPTNNGNTIGIQRAIKSKIRYKSDQSGNVINLSKYSFTLDTFKLLNKNVNWYLHRKSKIKSNKILMLKVSFTLSSFELTSRLSTQSQT